MEIEQLIIVFMVSCTIVLAMGIMQIREDIDELKELIKENK